MIVLQNLRWRLPQEHRSDAHKDRPRGSVDRVDYTIADEQAAALRALIAAERATRAMANTVDEPPLPTNLPTDTVAELVALVKADADYATRSGLTLATRRCFRSCFRPPQTSRGVRRSRRRMPAAGWRPGVYGICRSAAPQQSRPLRLPEVWSAGVSATDRNPQPPALSEHALCGMWGARHRQSGARRDGRGGPGHGSQAAPVAHFGRHQRLRIFPLPGERVPEHRTPEGEVVGQQG